MKIRTKFDLVPILDVIRRFVQEFICVQDTIHIGTKLRNRLLNSSIVLYIGNKIISIAHINKLIEIVSKEVHGLMKTDVFPEDRQNYKSLEKIMESRVLEALEKYVVDSEATIAYLTMCKLITSSYLDVTLTALERIYNIWYALYFFRCWRKWLSIQKDYSTKDNFISNNAYTCIEINAHALIEIIVKLRSNGQSHLFMPLYFASQPCEHIFRTMRSMGTANFTKINFTLNELFHMIGRLELMQKIVYSHQDITFPRLSKDDTSDLASDSASDNIPKSSPKSTVNIYALPSDEEIMQTMLNARTKALEKAMEFGICLNDDDITVCDLQYSRAKDAESMAANLTAEMSESFDDLEDIDDELYDEHENASTNMTDSESRSETMVEVFESDGSKKSILKSTFLWMLTESKDKLSTDRLKRVRGSSNQDSVPTGKKFKSIDYFGDGINILRCDGIKIGDWVLFKFNEIMLQSSSNNKNQNSYLIGNVIGFRNLDENGHVKQSKARYMSTIPNPNENDDKKVTEVLAIWYTCHEGKILEAYNGKLVVSKDQYLATIRPPTVQNILNKKHYVLPFEYSELDQFSGGSQSISQ